MDRMATIGDRSLVFVAITIAGSAITALSAQAAEECVHLGLENSLQHFSDFLATKHLQGA